MLIKDYPTCSTELKGYVTNIVYNVYMLVIISKLLSKIFITLLSEISLAVEKRACVESEFYPFFVIFNSLFFFLLLQHGWHKFESGLKRPRAILVIVSQLYWQFNMIQKVQCFLNLVVQRLPGMGW